MDCASPLYALRNKPHPPDVQVHPFETALASCGTAPVVRLWSPEAETTALPNATQRAVLRSNLMEVGRSQRLSRSLLGVMQVGGHMGATCNMKVGKQGQCALCRQAHRGAMLYGHCAV